MDHLRRWTVPIAADGAEPKRRGSHYVMVTADDGWLSFVANALPELERRCIPVALFAIPGYLGASLGQPDDRLVTADKLRSFNRGLVTIGSHTLRHARLTEFDEPAAWRELTHSRWSLERVVGRAITLFSFPFGAHSEALIRMCRDAGYERAFLAIPASGARQPTDFATDFVVGRILVDPSDWPLEFHLKLMDAYSWLPRMIRLKRRLLGAAQPAARIGRATSLPSSSISTGLTR
jgi:peptidoglycan/xylan/chitin deacetylase (PgdA/CDA1 family)